MGAGFGFKSSVNYGILKPKKSEALTARLNPEATARLLMSVVHVIECSAAPFSNHSKNVFLVAGKRIEAALHFLSKLEVATGHEDWCKFVIGGLGEGMGKLHKFCNRPNSISIHIPQLKTSDSHEQVAQGVAKQWCGVWKALPPENPLARNTSEFSDAYIPALNKLKQLALQQKQQFSRQYWQQFINPGAIHKLGPSFKKHTSIGSDNTHPREITGLPEYCLQELCEVFLLIVQECEWPQSLCHHHVMHSLGKKGGGSRLIGTLASWSRILLKLLAPISLCSICKST